MPIRPLSPDALLDEIAAAVDAVGSLVRDSTLNAANDLQMFTETFEAAVFRDGALMRIRQPVTPNGIARAAAG